MELGEDVFMYRPPINRLMRTLDRSFFHRKYKITAARVSNVQNISEISQSLQKTKEVLRARMLAPVQPDPDVRDKKCILLAPEVQPDDPKTWSGSLADMVRDGSISMIPYSLELDYNHWNAHEILEAILPEELLDDIPSGFNPVGHIAHFNLRPPYLPFRNLIGEVIIDKNAAIRTVINKTETLGEENEFRVLDYELMAGDDDMHVEHKETGCNFHFDFSKVFWNSRLATEHARLVDRFRPGEAVCDVMAGVGPFAVPAAKKGLFVWANDLNPNCYQAMQDCITLNKVSDFARAFNEDGHTFIRASAAALLHTQHSARVRRKVSRRDLAAGKVRPEDLFTTVEQPRTFSHYVMNLPSTAPDFLPDYAGLYAGHERLFAPHTDVRLPMVHCYCFGPKYEEANGGEAVAKGSVCAEASTRLGCDLRLGDEDLEVWDVRDVAPKKRQYCLSFRLPPEVAFRTVGAPT